jgi:hypothetical protein
MQVRCIRPRAGIAAGDLAEVPDGAEVSPLYFEAAEPPAETPPPAAPPPASAPAAPVPVSPRGMDS